MKTSRWVLGALLVGGFFALDGCGGAGTYQIPDVAPVVKQKPDDDLLENIEGNDTTPAATPSAEPPAAPASKTEEPKPADSAAPAADATKPPDAKPDGTKAAAKTGKAGAAKPAAAKPPATK